jgi:cell fate (sporulation/competence/biofilm development) regulator YmcA (YheA/YmcA/DUF963 family)
MKNKEIKKIKKKIRLLKKKADFDRRYDKLGVFSDSCLELDKLKIKLLEKDFT